MATSGALAALGAVRVAAQPAAPAAAMAQWEAAATIPLWPGAAPNGGFRFHALPTDAPPQFLSNIEHPYLRIFRPQKSNGRSLLSIPGGAYRFVSIANEGVDIAADMTARGYTVFVLAYRLPGEGWTGRDDVPLQDAQRAIRLIRARAAEFGTDPEQIYSVGFSAGGHLAASLETGFRRKIIPRSRCSRQPERAAPCGGADLPGDQSCRGHRPR